MGKKYPSRLKIAIRRNAKPFCFLACSGYALKLPGAVHAPVRYSVTMNEMLEKDGRNSWWQVGVRVMTHRTPRSPALQRDLASPERIPRLLFFLSVSFLFLCVEGGVAAGDLWDLSSPTGIEPGATAVKAWSSSHWTTRGFLLMSSPHLPPLSPHQGSVSASRVQRLDFLHTNNLPTENPSCVVISQCGRRRGVSSRLGKGPSLPAAPWSGTTTECTLVGSSGASDSASGNPRTEKEAGFSDAEQETQQHEKKLRF